MLSYPVTAMCPPSSGSSGRRLNAPRKKFRLASSRTKISHSPRSATSPPMTLAPTTLTGVSRSRSPPVTACHRSTTFAGIIASDCTVRTAMSPVNASDAGIADATLYWIGP